MPRVSVILPVYNGEQFLRLAMQSILDQTFRDLELIVVDDGSTDRTPEILRTFADTRMRVFRLPHNSGIVAALNGGLESAQGDLIARMDADDISLPERLEHQVAFLDAHPDVALLGSQTVVIDELGRTVRQECYPVTSGAVKKAALVHNPFAHGTVVIRRSVLEECGAYDPRFLHNEDYDLWLRLLARHAGANLPRVLVQRRVHNRSISSARHAELVRYRAKTLFHAALHYFRNPLYIIYAVRPAVAHLYWLVKGALRT